MLCTLTETWSYRSLIHALVVRHLAARYRGSLLGFLWSFLNPLFLMLVYTLVFQFYIRFDQVENYSIFLFCGLLPWIWTQSAIIEGTAAISASGHLITKSMFPAHVLVLVSILTSMIHYLLSLPLLFLFIYFSSIELYWTWLLFPLIMSLQALILYGLALALSSINVFFRDVQHLVGSILTLLFFLCPILYPRSTVPERFRFTLDLNPFAAITECYHAIFLEGVLPANFVLLSLVLWGLAFYVIGALVYRRYSDHFAELL